MSRRSSLPPKSMNGELLPGTHKCCELTCPSSFLHQNDIETVSTVPSRPARSPFTQRRQLDQVLAKLRQTVSQLHQTVSQVQAVRDDALLKLPRARNQHTPVNTLPVEILVMIFRIVVGPRRLRFARPYFLPNDSLNLAALRLTHVCCHWREVAQRQPLLWNTIIVRERGPADTPSSIHRHALHLAVGAPLHIFIESFRAVHSIFVDQLVACSEQLRIFYILNVVDCDQPDVVRLTRSPKLETLNLKRGGAGLWPSTIFDGLAPTLKDLHLGNLPTPCNNTFTNLTRLTLMSKQPSSPTSWVRSVLILLERNPYIREIRMAECCSLSRQDDNLDFSELAHTSIRLSKLRQLYCIHCHTIIVSAILQRLELPDDGLSMEVSQWLPWTATVRDLFPAALLSRWRSTKQPFTTLDIAFDNCAVTATTRTSVFSFQYPQEPTHNTLIADVRHIFPFTPVTTLNLRGHRHGSPAWSVNTCRRIFGKLTSLTNLSLTLRYKNTEEWLDSLLTTQTEGKPCPVPMLLVLRVAVPLQNDERAMLLDVVADRNSSGHRLRTLHIVSDTRYGKYSSEEKMREGLGGWLEKVKQFVDEIKFEVITKGYVLERPVPSYMDLYPLL